MLADKPVNAVELSALRQDELQPLVDDLGNLDVHEFAYAALHTVNKAPTPRSRRLLPLWIIVDLHRRSLFSRCVVGTRSRLPRAAGYQPLAIRERPRGAWPNRAHDLPEGSPSIRDSAGRGVTEHPVSQHPSGDQGDTTARLHCEVQPDYPTIPLA